ncbi:AraC family transcriptional regulator [Aquimarina sp. M1]
MKVTTDIIKEIKPPKEFISIQERLNGTLLQKQGGFELIPDPEIGHGKIKYTYIQPGLHSLDFNVKMGRDIKLPINAFSTDELNFIYCLKGSCFYHFQDSGQPLEIKELRSAVVHNKKEHQGQVHIKNGKNLILNSICVNKSEYRYQYQSIQDHFTRKFQILISDIDKKPKRFYQGNYNFSIAQQIKSIDNQDFRNLMPDLLCHRGRYLIILAKHIEQYFSEKNDKHNDSGLLKEELKKITRLGQHIMQQPEKSHSIKSLCKRSGLAPSKLQQGFKFVFDCTVASYIRDIRLEKAEQLLRTTDLNVSEVVYSIGLTSRSYFCKIFKRKYRCTPKEYKTKPQKD